MRSTQEINNYIQKSETIKRLKFVFFRYYKGPHEFEDFYHDYAIHLLSGFGQHQTMDQFFIDWYRKVSSFNRLSRMSPKFFTEGFSGIRAPESHLSQDYISLIRELVGKYNGRIRIILILYYIYELDMSEIGFILNLTESRISQIIKRVKSGVKITDKTVVDEINSIDEPEIDKIKKENRILRSKLHRSFRAKVAQNSKGS